MFSLLVLVFTRLAKGLSLGLVGIFVSCYRHSLMVMCGSSSYRLSDVHNDHNVSLSVTFLHNAFANIPLLFEYSKEASGLSKLFCFLLVLIMV